MKSDAPRKTTRRPAGVSRETSLARLRAENRALRKTVRALMVRVERAFDREGTPFSWFQAAAKLEETVRLRTEQYELLNARLTRELEARGEIERALREAKQQADLANESKTRFLAAASHDLRQPLNSALLLLESVDEQALPERDRALVQRSRLALVSLNNLLGTLLDVARLDSGGIEPHVADFPLAEVFDRIGPEFESVARALSIELRLRPSRAWVSTDAHLLETVVRNFISNAIRYTPEGRVLIGCRRRGDAVMICVYDTGIGIDRKHVEAIFQPYYQVPAAARRSGAGIGLGLSIVSRLSQLLSLERIVRSEPGKGSLFAVIVPRARGNRHGGRVDEAAVSSGERTRPLNIVVIDDDADALLGLSTVLERWGCHAIPASTGGDALARLSAGGTQPDLILTDYHLGAGLKGDRAVVEIRRLLECACPAVVVTSDPDQPLRDSLRRRGFTVLTKPINLAKLRALLQRLPG